ncbi:MAG TPA: hybrid sensor histidine kinase/response regulator [Candidatus Thermoplasmatota archaeon]|nr:hybrid sensor histidine kinase/response regulator [Candidatus Thermoplasmatota archaeon]
MSDEPMRVLLVEDNPHDAVLLKEALAEILDAPIAIEHVTTLGDARSRLQRGNIDEVLLDLKLPDSAGLSSLDAIQEAAPGVPVLVLTGIDDEVLATGAMRRGAQDYIVKGDHDPHNLYRAMRYAVERRRAEAARAEAEEQAHELQRLREVDAMRARIIQTAAHELRTPLTPLTLQVHILKFALGAGLMTEASRAAVVLERNIARLSHLVEDVLDVSRIQDGRLAIQRATADLGSVAADAVEVFRAPAEQAGITLRFVKDGDTTIEADEKRIAQVLFNLVGNALKFTPAGGQVEVRVRGDAEAVTLSVVDSGLGIGPDAIPRLFEPFVQVHDLARSAVGGTGLGLFICRGIVEQHSGRIWCESGGAGKGSAFHVRIPKTPKSGAVKPAKAPS